MRLTQDIQRVNFAPLELRRLKFNEWQFLSKANDFHRDGFDKTDPVFFQTSFAESDTANATDLYCEIWPTFENEVYYLYFLVLLNTAFRLPEPNLSVSYYLDNQINKVVPAIGFLGYESVAYTKPSSSYVLEQNTIEKIQSCLNKFPLDLQDHPFKVTELANAKDTLIQFSRSDISEKQDFVYCCIAIESLLIPEPVRSVAKCFATRGAILFSAGNAKIYTKNYRCFELLYNMRSRIVHGDKCESAKRELSNFFNTHNPFGIARWILCQVLLLMMNHQQCGNFCLSQFVLGLEQKSAN